MQVSFFTKNINRGLYRQLLWKYLEEHIDSIPNPISRDRINSLMRDAQVKIYPSTMLEENMKAKGNTIDQYVTNFRVGTSISYMIPTEITSPRLVEAYVVDMKNDLIDASNFIMLSHGMAHMLLNAVDPDRYDTLIVPDLSGHPAGWRGKWHTVAVHNKTNTPGNTYKIKLYKLLGLWKPVEYYVFNFKKEMQEA